MDRLTIASHLSANSGQLINLEHQTKLKQFWPLFYFLCSLGQTHCGAIATVIWGNGLRKKGWDPQKAHSPGHWPDLASRQGQLYPQYLWQGTISDLVSKHTLRTQGKNMQQPIFRKQEETITISLHSFLASCLWGQRIIQLRRGTSSISSWKGQFEKLGWS